jgi:hypothetical protein
MLTEKNKKHPVAEHGCSGKPDSSSAFPRLFFTAVHQIYSWFIIAANQPEAGRQSCLPERAVGCIPARVFARRVHGIVGPSIEPVLLETKSVAMDRCPCLPQIDSVRRIGVVIGIRYCMFNVDRSVRIANRTTECDSEMTRVLPPGRDNSTAPQARWACGCDNR